MAVHVLQVRIIAEDGDKCVLEKRFFLMWQIHNQLVKYANRQLNKLRNDRAYIDAKRAYIPLKKELDKLESADKPDKDKISALEQDVAEYSDIMYSRVKEFSLTDGGLKAYAKVMQHRFKDHLTSQQVQKEATRVYGGIEKVLYGNGTCLHLKKVADQKTISQACSTNGIKVDLEAKMMSWCKLEMRLDFDTEDPYVAESIGHKLKYAEIKRLAFNNGWHYYLNLYFADEAPKRMKAQPGIVGIDPGVSTIAAVSEKAVSIKELAPDCKKYDQEIAKQQRLIDKQMRQANPDNYNSDGTAKKGKHNWVVTKGCRKRKQKIRVLYRLKSAYTQCCHNQQINELIVNYGTEFVAEKMDYKALAKRSKKKAERQEKESVVKKKDGTEKTVRKFKRKKRFGKSVNDRSPSAFLTTLERKAKQYGGILVYTNTWEFKGSQYRHDTDTYEKVSLSDRWKTIDDHEIQRDLYSAFLQFCTDPSGTHADRDKCLLYFPQFLKLHDEYIEATKDMPHPACFGY